MSVKLSEIIKYIENIAPKSLAEDYDNSGLIIGRKEKDIKRVMVCLDVTSKVVEEAVEKNTDLIVSHHPLIFKGLKRINYDDVKGRIIYNLIRNDIAVYSAHTNLDVADGGVNEHLAEVLGLSELENLKRHRTLKLYKVVVFVPEENIDNVRDAMSRAGAGWIGNYSDCSFMTKGTGTFRPLEGTNPYIGSKGKLEFVDEIRLETVVPQEKLHAVIDEMIKSHPYEEVAYDVYPLNMEGKVYGLGKVGVLKTPVTLDDFIATVKEKLNAKSVRVIGSADKKIEKVAVFCGSFDESCIKDVLSKADILVTGDVKYHTAVEIAEMGMCVIDAGHFNTERIIVPKLVNILSDKFKNLDVFSNSVEEEPFITY
ncbi:Nif3-like dinuclear metal center hexameric protein [Acetivibrio saccincola]|jgi:dinuclear metal center YbgI/SA1388 family protein|uniref:Nif3-like dinuclear metal center hexameric protein n=1 Tax=Acetivibrio saccincola TaxID=1677857 RepID=UPI000A8B048F|nr:Nif3-like dinuclear metal center hexameric protein [Acetivibrio saccincola]NLW25843.1 Nif3-like dinuclear metal center hexameric protein [Acetivibrio saccincola]HQD28038.1 Nif3-like dinuclear metal center hexameric protein [Acetivibrio saccincola]